MAYTVIGTPASVDLAKKIAKILGAKNIQSKIQVFYDGESKITLPQNPRGKTVIVSSIHPPPDTSLVQTLSLVFEAKRHASEVIAIIPYLAYMRQDIEFLPGEIITSSVVAKLLSARGASRIITADIHSEIALDYFDVPLSNVNDWLLKLALLLLYLNDKLIFIMARIPLIHHQKREKLVGP